MRLINASVSVMDNLNGREMLKKIEAAGRGLPLQGT